MNSTFGRLNRPSTHQMPQWAILDAAFTFLGYAPESGAIRADHFKFLLVEFDSVFAVVRRSLPDIEEDAVWRMLAIMDPEGDYPYLDARNEAAHRVRVGEARDAAGYEIDRGYPAEGDAFSLWIDLIAGVGADAHVCLAEAAFERGYDVEWTSQQVAPWTFVFAFGSADGRDFREPAEEADWSSESDEETETILTPCGEIGEEEEEEIDPELKLRMQDAMMSAWRRNV